MKTSNQRNGNSFTSTIFFVLFLGSLVLNVAFLSGCCVLPPQIGGGVGDRPVPSEAEYLRAIANRLGLDPDPGKTPGDIKCDIDIFLDNAQSYDGNTFSDAEVDEISLGMVEKEKERFKSYQKFIKSVKGKQIIILPDTEK